MKNKPGKSLCVIFFKISDGITANEVGNGINQLWSMYSNLKQGMVKNLAINKKLLLGGNLSVLIAYGPKTFSIPEINKLIPTPLQENPLFESPRRWARGAISEHSELCYSNEVSENHAASDHFMVQLIADNEFFSSKALVQTWREVKDINDKFGDQLLLISNWYTGFQSEDNRNWLGFHDGISNMKSNERIRAIAIDDSKYLGSGDKWLIGGTYLAYLRIMIELDSWDILNIYDQEMIIGREKLTGCPIIGVDQKGKPIKDPRCPVNGTFEVIQEGNEYFREHPSYGTQKNLPYGVKDSPLKNSHVARSFEVNPLRQWKTEFGRIFRQGFQFLESKNEYPGFRVGLNFISFQNNPANFFRSISRKTDILPDYQRLVQPLESYLSVQSAGIFVVPPVVNHEKFPGSGMFFE